MTFEIKVQEGGNSTYADKLSLEVRIVGLQLAEQEALNKAVERVLSYGGAIDCARIVCSPQLETGWLEYSILLEFCSGGRMQLGMLQRSVGAEWEFHS